MWTYPLISSNCLRPVATESSLLTPNPPLFLALFSLLSPWTSLLLYAALDLEIAHCLCNIAKSGAAYSSRLYTSPRKGRSWSPISVAAVYRFKPLTLMTCLARPTAVFTTPFTLYAVSSACEARPYRAAFSLAVASYISLHSLLLVHPVGLLCYDRAKGRPDAVVFGAKLARLVTETIMFLLLLSRWLLPSWTFLESVHLTPLTMPDLTSNPGLWWCLFIEMFDAFRNFFLGVFWLHMLSYSVPLTIRLKKQPLAAVILMLGVISVIQPYANIADTGAWLCSLTLLGHVFELSSAHRYTFPALATLLYCMFLGPAFHHLWVYAGSGNANFFYAINLVWSLDLLVLLAGAIYAVMRDEWEQQRPECKGNESRQI
ncbi:PIG-U-domain-containing protein [Piedraia hortae CBS 480.64]|uniref:PIG-U-domain-containing protein n=1 Tax=Piedraia hortae CBS 480.64 TaxID=1314780 RepID=A0A6A7BW47_9PEZI|nr:PIG-U-domain-containing protein [Piedraia hortae CBS 480.64]